MLRRVGALPGVESVGMSASNRTPFSGSGVTQRFTFVGESTAPADVRRAQFQVASPDYFSTLKSPILSGRAFTAADALGSRAGRHRQRNAREDAVSGQGSRSAAASRSAGSRPASSASSPTFTTMGSTCRWRREIYFPLFQRSNNALTVYYRSSTDPASLNTTVERAIHAIDPTLPVFGQSTMENLLADSMVRRKVVLSLMAAFAVVALLLAAIGTYGVMSVAAHQRVREIGIRMALGAQRRDIERLMVRPGLVLAAAGVAARHRQRGVPDAADERVLFAVAPTDAVTYASVSLLLILVALAACYVPARRATKQDPLVALRTE